MTPTASGEHQAQSSALDAFIEDGAPYSRDEWMQILEAWTVRDE